MASGKISKVAGLVLGVLWSFPLWGQSPGVVRAQEIFSSTHHVKVDNSVNTPIVTVTFANPTTFDANSGNHFKETLTGNVGSSTLANAVSGTDYYFSICQDGVGSHTFVWPANFLNTPTVSSAVNQCTNLVGFFDGTNVNITGQWTTLPGGGGTAGGTVTSVGLAGDGTVFNTTVPGSPITTSGTLQPTLVSASSGTFLGGPIGSQGTNVGVRQFVHCTFTTAVNNDAAKTFACPAFASSVIAGDAILVVSPQIGPRTGTSSFTDSLGNTLTNVSVGVVGTSSPTVAYGTVTVGGNDTVTGTNVAWWDNGGSPGHSQYDFWVYELVGSLAVVTATSNQTAGSSNPEVLTTNTTPGAATDAFIRLALNGSNFVATPSTGTFTFGPAGNPISTFNSADIGMGFGATDFFAPGNTTVVSNTATWNFTAAPGAGGMQYLMVVDLSQSPSAGSAPPVYRRIQEGDLPASAISAIQSVQTFNIAATVPLPSNTNTTVISQSITMPSSGCPCRVLISYSGVEAVGGSGTVTSWVTDGTNSYATVQANTTDATAMPITGYDITASYGNTQAVTFTWKVNPGTYATGTYQMNTGFASSTSTQSGHMTLTIVQSRN